MRKTWLLFGFLFLLLGSVHSDEPESIDLVVVLDTSSSMHDGYREVSDYIIGPLLQKFLRIGDTFHLISFSGQARTELSRRIEGVGDVQTIIGRTLLMFPLNPHSDVITALDYVARYLNDLPETRRKTVLFVSDGRHEPAAGSPNYGLSREAVDQRLTETAARLKGNGWSFYFIQVPVAAAADPTAGLPARETAAPGAATGDAQTGAQDDPDAAAVADAAATDEADVSDTVSRVLNAPVIEYSGSDAADAVSIAVGALSVAFPADIGNTGRRVRIPLSLSNPSPQAIYLETTAILIDGTDRMVKRAFRNLKARSDGTLDLVVQLPADFPLGVNTMEVEPVFSGNIRISPAAAPVALTLVDAPLRNFVAGVFPVLIFVLGLIVAGVLAILILLISRRLHAAPNRLAAVEERKKASPGASTADAELPAGFAAQNQKERSLPAGVVSAAPRDGSMQQTMMDHPGVVPAPVIKPSRSASAGSGGTSVSPLPPYPVYDEQARITLSLFVEDQNTAIGRRNVHLLKAGHTLTLGGGHSDFLVFLVPIPAHVAEVRFDGKKCLLIPRRGGYFPDLDTRPLDDCVGKTVRMISDKGYELKIRLDQYQDPLEKLNRFLHSIEFPG